MSCCVNINNITVPDNFYGACVRVLVHRWGWDLDEAIQEGLFKLVEAIDAGKTMDNVTSYIARALNNKEIEKFRRRVRFNHVSFEGCEEFEAREELLFYDKLTGEFEMMIESAREVEKEMLRDHHVEGLDHREMSIKYGIPKATIKTKMFRIHRRLETKVTYNG